MVQAVDRRGFRRREGRCRAEPRLSGADLAGRTTATVVPMPGLELICNWPPLNSAMARAMAMPLPLLSLPSAKEVLSTVSVSGGDADAGIGEFEDDAIIGRPGGDGDAAAGTGELEAVVDDVADQPLEIGLVAEQDAFVAALDKQADAGARCLFAITRLGPVEQFIEPDRLSWRARGGRNRTRPVRACWPACRAGPRPIA